MCADAPVCADDSSQPQLVGVEAADRSVRIVCRVTADPADDRVQFEWLVWPGVAADVHPQRSPSVVATGSYVTTAVSGPRNDTAAAGLVIGELVLPATAVGGPDASHPYAVADRAGPTSSKRPAVLDTVSCRAANSVGRQQNPCLYHIVPACEYYGNRTRLRAPR